MPIDGIVAGSLVRSSTAVICEAMGIPMSTRFLRDPFGPFNPDPQTGLREPGYLVGHHSAGAGNLNDVQFAHDKRSYNEELVYNSPVLYPICTTGRSGHSIDAVAEIHRAYQRGQGALKHWQMDRPDGNKPRFNPAHRESWGISVAHNGTTHVMSDSCVGSFSKIVAARLVIMRWDLNRWAMHYNMKPSKIDINDKKWCPTWGQAELWSAIQEQIPRAQVFLGFKEKEPSVPTEKIVDQHVTIVNGRLVMYQLKLDGSVVTGPYENGNYRGTDAKYHGGANPGSPGPNMPTGVVPTDLDVSHPTGYRIRLSNNTWLTYPDHTVRKDELVGKVIQVLPDGTATAADLGILRVVN